MEGEGRPGQVSLSIHRSTRVPAIEGSPVTLIITHRYLHFRSKAEISGLCVSFDSPYKISLILSSSDFTVLRAG
ncbi:hypothetical protein MRB53_012386 [Persea americana]|uniref:Uncharacterized protein n=1 Tax=Persea americana TaxID=3435 RepID=A0ACC2LXS7_PERAE|nr:hypothetical protein MRB53_012386 [Persea americana]